MFKRNPYLLGLNLLLFILLISFINIPLIKLLIFLILFITSRDKSTKSVDIYSLIVFIIILIHSICGKIVILSNILLIIYYLLIMLVSLTKYDLLKFATYIFYNQKYSFVIKIIYFKEYFIKNYQLIIKINKDMGYNMTLGFVIYALSFSFNKTLSDLNKVVDLFINRLYYNTSKNRLKILITGYDLLVTLIYFICVIIAVIVR